MWFLSEGFDLFLLVLGIGAILLWHSLGLPFNYFETINQIEHYMSSVARKLSGFPTMSDTTGLYSHRGWLEAYNFGVRK